MGKEKEGTPANADGKATETLEAFLRENTAQWLSREVEQGPIVLTIVKTELAEFNFDGQPKKHPVLTLQDEKGNKFKLRLTKASQENLFIKQPKVEAWAGKTIKVVPEPVVIAGQRKTTLTAEWAE